MHPVETLETILFLLGAAVALHLLAAKMRLPPSAALLIGVSMRRAAAIRSGRS